MIICVAGDVHGAVDKFYEYVLRFEQTLGENFEWVLQVGDFGVWPDPKKVDPVTDRHAGPGDFHRWLSMGSPVPRRTAFIQGNHEDFDWLAKNGVRGEILPGLVYIPNGQRFDLVSGGHRLSVGAMGGSYAGRDYERPAAALQGRAKRHYTRDQVERLMMQGKLDILLTHEAPAGAFIEKGEFGDGYKTDVEGLDDLLLGTSPKACFSGHHHAAMQCEIAGVRCFGLNKIGEPGSLVAVRFDEDGDNWSVLGEWPYLTERKACIGDL